MSTPGGRRHRLDSRRRSDQDRHDQPGGAASSAAAATASHRMHHRRGHRGAAGGAGQNGAHAVVTADLHIRQRRPAGGAPSQSARACRRCR